MHTPPFSLGQRTLLQCPLSLCRLTHVSPVWYQLRSSSGVLTLTGGHDVDAGWVAAVRQPCPNQVRRPSASRTKAGSCLKALRAAVRGVGAAM